MDFAKCEQCGGYFGLIPMGGVMSRGWTIKCVYCEAWDGDTYDTLDDAVEAYGDMRDANS